MTSPLPGRALAAPLIGAAILTGGYVVQARRERALSRETFQAPLAREAPARADRPPELPFELTEASRRAGVINTHALFVPAHSLSHIAPWITHIGMGAGVAVADFDGDGWPDIYLPNSAVGSRNKLFRNNHDGTFTDVAARAGVADINREAGSVRALFFDYDNDGRKDLLVTTTYCPKLFHNNGDGTFTDVTARSGLDYCGLAPAVNVVDYDNDGYLDVVFGAYYQPLDLSRPATMEFMPNNWFAADNGGPIVVFHNNGDGTFSRVPGNLGIKSRGWSLALGVYDLRGTGRPDLYFATDFGFDQVYLNEGGGRFSDGSRLLSGTFSRHGMNAEAADLDNDGAAAVFVTHIYHPGQVMDQNVVWKVGKDGRFRNTSVERGLDRCGWSWGAKFVDLDNRGWLDVVVTNGMISGDPRKNFWSFTQAYDRSANGVFGPLFSDARKWPDLGNASMAGYEKKCVYYNRQGRFEEIASRTAFAGDRSDGRALAVIDYMNDGSLSLVEANVGQRARFYANRQLNQNHWIGFELVGTRSNRDSFGAEAFVKLKDGRTLSRQLQTANGYLSQDDPRLHFGLGPEPVIESARVRWPSGAELRLKAADLELDRYHKLVEPR